MLDNETSAYNTDVIVIPSQDRVSQKILTYCQTFRDLKLMFVVSCRDEQLVLYYQQLIVATVEDSVRRTEMTDLESQEDETCNRVLWFKPMS